MKRNLTSFVLLLIVTVSHSQKQFFDYIVTNSNDTIYGVLKNVPSSRAVLLEINPNAANPGEKLQARSLKNVKTIRWNDKIYHYSKRVGSDGIYGDEPLKSEENPTVNVTIRKGDFVHVEPVLQDYLVTRKNDTIYGTINNTAFGLPNLTDKNNNKIKVEYDEIASYRLKNSIYVFREVAGISKLISTKSPIRLLAEGKVNLYQYDYDSPASQFSTTYYYIEKNNQFTIINVASRGSKQKEQLRELFADNANLAALINSDAYDMDNIYLIVNYYNNH